MKMIKFSAFLLMSGLFLASCGDGQNDENYEDSTIMEENMEMMPDTVNGIDTTVNMNTTTMVNEGYSDTPNTRKGAFDEDLPKNNTDESTVGKPTKNPGKSPKGGHPDRLPDNPSPSSPSM